MVELLQRQDCGGVAYSTLVLLLYLWLWFPYITHSCYTQYDPYNLSRVSFLFTTKDLENNKSKVRDVMKKKKLSKIHLVHDHVCSVSICSNLLLVSQLFIFILNHNNYFLKRNITHLLCYYKGHGKRKTQQRLKKARLNQSYDSKLMTEYRKVVPCSDESARYLSRYIDIF